MTTLLPELRGPARPLPGDDAPAGERKAPRTLEELSLQALLELSQEIHATGDLYRVTELGLLKFMGNLGTASSALWVISQQSGRPVLLRSLGIPRQVAEGLGELCVGRIVAAGDAHPEPFFVEELGALLDPAALALAQGAKLGLFGLLYSSGRPIGAIALGRHVAGGPYSPGQLRILQASLHHLGVALDNTLLHASTLEQNRELRQARARLQELDELKQQFLDNLHHELKTPLTVILSYADLLRSGTFGPEQSREFLAELSAQAGRLRGMIENLLTFRELRDDLVSVTPVPTDLAPLLGDYHEERRPGLARDLREFVVRLDPTLPPALCDPGHLRRILDELVGNAAKFSPEGSRITLRALRDRRDGATAVRLEVEDTGPGIAPERLARAFEPFEQLDGSLTRATGGIGLGLPLARELARNLGGELELRDLPGRGTVCTLWLRCPADATAPGA
ncbi:MAG: sensor histidine kinase [Candidatus Krumholzibacteriia bacterium]